MTTNKTPARWHLGLSAQGRALEAFASAPARQVSPANPTISGWPWLLLVGGVHGDEIEGVWLLESLIERWRSAFASTRLGAVVFPRANPDGVALGQRWNARGVDLNRNLPTRDWTAQTNNPRYPPGPSPASEPESLALVDLISACRPLAILSAHSFSRFQINVNGPARAWGDALSRICGYPVTEEIGYPTPGCLGTYAGQELGIATITLEIERGLPRDRVLAVHLPVLEETLTFWERETRRGRST